MVLPGGNRLYCRHATVGQWDNMGQKLLCMPDTDAGLAAALTCTLAATAVVPASTGVVYWIWDLMSPLLLNQSSTRHRTTQRQSGKLGLLLRRLLGVD
jgi:hypothetical protein